MALAQPSTFAHSDGTVAPASWVRTGLNREALGPQTRALQRAVAETEKLATDDQARALEESRTLLVHSLKVVTAARLTKKPTEADARSLRSRLRLASEKSCQTILHYQGVFDVLNEQAPEYSTAAWGAIKLICLAVVNKTEIENRVNDELTGLVWAFRELEINAGASAYEGLVAIVTEAYAGFLAFLTKVVKYIGHHRPTKWALALVKPWKLEFQPDIDKIHKDLQTARNMAQAITNVHVKKIDIAVTDGFTKLDDKIDFFKAYCDEGWNRSAQRSIKDFQALRHYLSILSGQQLEVLNAVQTAALPGVGQRFEILDDDGQSLYATRPRGQIEPLSDFIEKGNNSSDPLTCRLREIFPSTAQLELDRRQLYSRILPDLELDSAGSFNVTRNELVHRWLSTSASQLLWIDGFRDHNSTAWTTNFALEILKASDAAEEVSIVYLHVFSDDIIEALDGETSPAAAIMQSLLMQFFDQCRGSFGTTTCMKHDLTVRALHEAKDDIPKLINVFSVLIELATPSNCLIVVDNIERIASHSDLTSHAAREDFFAVLKLLKRISRDDTLCTKVLVTARMGPVVDYLMKDITEPATAHDRHKVAMIPTQEVLYGATIASDTARRFSTDPNVSEKVDRALEALKLNNIDKILETEGSPTKENSKMSMSNESGYKDEDDEDDDDLNELLGQKQRNNLIDDLLKDGEKHNLDGDQLKKARSPSTPPDADVSPTDEDDPTVRWILDKSQRTLSAQDREDWVQNLFDDGNGLVEGRNKGSMRKDSTHSVDSLENFLPSVQPIQEAQEEKKGKNLLADMGIDFNE